MEYLVIMTGPCYVCEGAGETACVYSCGICLRAFTHKEIDAVLEDGRDKPYPLMLPCGHSEKHLNDGIARCDACEGRGHIRREVPLREALAAIENSKVDT